MSAITLEQDNRAGILESLNDDTWAVACLCAAWCDVCKAYRAGFDELAAQHPDKRFLWIDIEDQADVVGDLDIENFPTLLLQRGDQVAFLAPSNRTSALPDAWSLPMPRRLSHNCRQKISGNPEHRQWQDECNLRQRLLENS